MNPDWTRFCDAYGAAVPPAGVFGPRRRATGLEWRDKGVLLAVRRHGENAAIIDVFSEAHGRHSGVVRGGASRKIAPVLQPGAQLDLTWRARLEEHLGAFTVEPFRSRAGLMADRTTLAALNAVAALLLFALPERESHGALYARTQTLLDMMEESAFWPVAYVRWEMSLLDELGFGLDLETCAATGTREGLAFISPRTGRAVSEKAAGDWADRLLPLSATLIGGGSGTVSEVLEALRVTGHFLETGLAHSLGNKPLPEARARLIDRLSRSAQERPST